MKKPCSGVPVGLSDPAAAFWKSVTTNFELEDHHLQILQCACRALDRAAEAAALCNGEGIVTHDRWGQAKVHPAVLVERDNRALFAKLLRELGLDRELPDERRSHPVMGRGRR